MDTSQTIYTYRLTRKVRTGGSGCLAALFYIASFLCVLIGIVYLVLWPLALILFAIGWAVDAKTAHVSTCGHCGNDVSNNSCLCPVCHADLAPEPITTHWTSKLFYAALIVAPLILAALYYFRRH